VYGFESHPQHICVSFSLSYSFQVGEGGGNPEAHGTRSENTGVPFGSLYVLELHYNLHTHTHTHTKRYPDWFKIIAPNLCQEASFLHSFIEQNFCYLSREYQ
jgi:hypothetical protein